MEKHPTTAKATVIQKIGAFFKRFWAYIVAVAVGLLAVLALLFRRRNDFEIVTTASDKIEEWSRQQDEHFEKEMESVGRDVEQQKKLVVEMDAGDLVDEFDRLGY